MHLLENLEQKGLPIVAAHLFWLMQPQARHTQNCNIIILAGGIDDR